MDAKMVEVVERINAIQLAAVDRLPSVSGPPSATLRDIGLSDEIFLTLVSRARLNEPLSSSLRSQVTRALGLVEPQELPPDPTDWSIRCLEHSDYEESKYVHEKGGLVSDHADKAYGDQITVLLSSTDEALWQSTFPFRVRGEAGLRRLRLSDLPLIYSDPERLRANLEKLSSCRSYIYVLNMCLADIVCSAFKFIEWYHSRDALTSIATFLAFAKRVTTELKAVVYPDSYLMLVENTVFPGYRLLPDPAFDIVEKTKQAASGFGLIHTTSDGLAESWGWGSCSHVLNVSAVPPPISKTGILSFSDFLSSPALWSTSGSSSFGRLFYRDGADVRRSVKARKLMLPFITTPGKLADIASSVTTTHATSLVKSELAKIRIAVASELGFYLIWSYLHYLYGDLYLTWPGVTLGETAWTELERLDAMLTACPGSWGFPADFEQFDAQPLTSEIVSIGSSLLRAASMVSEIPSYIKRSCLYGLASSELSTPRQPDGMVHTYKVENYLPSGVAITSAVGNGFNCVASQSMIKLVSAWTCTHESIWLKNLALRGDDSSFIVTHVCYALLLSLAAKMLNYRHAAFKVALLSEATELLRVSISAAHGCRGYPARLIPTLTQRKPWSNDPWDAEGVVRAHWDTCAALERRRMPGYDLWLKLRLIWTKKRNLALSCLTASPLDGGLGLGPPERIFCSISPGMAFKARAAASVETSGWAEALKATEFRDFGIAVPKTVVSQMVQAQAIATLTTVDLPDAAKISQRAYKDQLRSQTVMERPIRGFFSGYRSLLTTMCQTLSSIDSPQSLREATLSYRPATFGKFRSVSKVLSLNREIAPYSLIRLDYPIDFANAVVRLMLRFRCPRSTAEDWLVGDAVSGCLAHVHPNLQVYISNIAIHAVERASDFAEIYRLGLGVVIRLTFWEVGLAFSQSILHQRLYSW